MTAVWGETCRLEGRQSARGCRARTVPDLRRRAWPRQGGGVRGPLSPGRAYISALNIGGAGGNGGLCATGRAPGVGGAPNVRNVESQGRYAPACPPISRSHCRRPALLQRGELVMSTAEIIYARGRRPLEHAAREALSRFGEIRANLTRKGTPIVLKTCRSRRLPVPTT